MVISRYIHLAQDILDNRKENPCARPVHQREEKEGIYWLGFMHSLFPTGQSSYKMGFNAVHCQVASFGPFSCLLGCCNPSPEV